MTLLKKFMPIDFILDVKNCKKCSLNLIKLFLVPITKYLEVQYEICLQGWKMKAVTKCSIPPATFVIKYMYGPQTCVYTCISCHVQQWTRFCFNCHLHWSVTYYSTVPFHCKIHFYFCSVFLSKLLTFNEIYLHRYLCQGVHVYVCVCTHCVFVLVIFKSVLFDILCEHCVIIYIIILLPRQLCIYKCLQFMD